jgi:hypothetical protein
MVTATKAAGRRGSRRAVDHDASGDPAGTAADRRDTSTAGHPRAAAERAARHSSTQMRVPVLGTVRLPAREELAFLGGVGVLAVVGAIEWPVAAVLGAGHLLASNRRNRALREFGEALEER